MPHLTFVGTDAVCTGIGQDAVKSLTCVASAWTVVGKPTTAAEQGHLI